MSEEVETFPREVVVECECGRDRVAGHHDEADSVDETEMTPWGTAKVIESFLLNRSIDPHDFEELKSIVEKIDGDPASEASLEKCNRFDEDVIVREDRVAALDDLPEYGLRAIVILIAPVGERVDRGTVDENGATQSRYASSSAAS
jgi:hypothetical protein